MFLIESLCSKVTGTTVKRVVDILSLPMPKRMTKNGVDKAAERGGVTRGKGAPAVKELHVSGRLLLFFHK